MKPLTNSPDRLLTKVICLCLLTSLFACGHEVVVPEPELVHIIIKSDTVIHQLPNPVRFSADSAAVNPQLRKWTQTD